MSPPIERMFNDVLQANDGNLSDERECGGFERRVDADPLDLAPRPWALAGFRLVSP